MYGNAWGVNTGLLSGAIVSAMTKSQLLKSESIDGYHVMFLSLQFRSVSEQKN